MEDVNKNILRMIGLYRVATRQTVATLLPDDQEPDKRLKRLLVERYVQVHRGFSGNRTLYQLTKRGAAAVGLSEARARRMGGQALLKHLGILFYCHADDGERHRVEERELASAVDGKVPDASHCICQQGDEVLVVNCYVPGPHTPAATVSRHLRGLIAEAKGASKAVADLVRANRYRFAVIVDSTDRKKAVMAALRTPEKETGRPLLSEARIAVEVVKEFATIRGTGAPGLGDVRSGHGERAAWD